jgi:hypothetical protein
LAESGQKSQKSLDYPIPKISPSHATHPSNNIRSDGMVGTITELNKFADNKLSQIGGNLERFEQ